MKPTRQRVTNGVRELPDNLNKIAILLPCLATLKGQQLPFHIKAKSNCPAENCSWHLEMGQGWMGRFKILRMICTLANINWEISFRFLSTGPCNRATLSVRRARGSQVHRPLLLKGEFTSSLGNLVRTLSWNKNSERAGEMALSRWRYLSCKPEPGTCDDWKEPAADLQYTHTYTHT